MFHLFALPWGTLMQTLRILNKIFIRRIQKRTLSHLCLGTKEHSYKEVNLYLYIYIFIILRAVRSNWYNPFDLSIHMNVSTKTKLYYFNITNVTSAMSFLPTEIYNVKEIWSYVKLWTWIIFCALPDNAILCFCDV